MLVEVVDSSDNPAIFVRVVHMLHIVRPLARVASYHGLGPALDEVPPQGAVVRCLVSCHHDVVQHGHQVVDVGGLLTGPICPGYFVTTDRFLSLYRGKLAFLKRGIIDLFKVYIVYFFLVQKIRVIQIKPFLNQ